jgi:ABC-type transport system involved in multi-copper enzyme maturation permease subunit
MPIHRERYRRREGGADLGPSTGAGRPERVEGRGGAWLVIAAHGLRSIARKRAFLFLMILSWIPVVVRGVQIWAAANVPGMSQIGMLAVTPHMFRDFLNQQEPLVFFITVYVGSGLIADDIRANALQLYLSRPITRTQYIAGKAAILMGALAAVTLVPAMLLLLLVPAFAGRMTFLWNNFSLVASISAYSVIQITLSAFLILALSSLSKSRWFVAILYAGLAFFTHAVFGVLGAAMPGSAFSWVSIFANVRQVGDVLFRLPPRHDTHPLISAGVIVLIIAASAAVLRRRIRAIEVVT